MWRVYYDGRAPFPGDAATAFDAPAWGVLLIVEQSQEHGRRVVSNGDYYVWQHGAWWAKDFIGLIDYLAEPGPRKVLIGRMVPNPVWEKAWREAEADTTLPERTGFAADEPRA